MKDQEATASCQQCEWTAGPADEPTINKAALSHVHETGHDQVTISYNDATYPPGRKL